MNKSLIFPEKLTGLWHIQMEQEMLCFRQDQEEKSYLFQINPLHNECQN